MEHEKAAVRRVLDGDRDAFRVIVGLHSRSIFKLAFRIMGNESDADDVVQETFLRAYTKLGDFQWQASLRTWLCRIASNYCMDLLAKRKQEATIAVSDEGFDAVVLDHFNALPDPERLAMSREAGRTVETAMADLTAKERAVFVMRHMHGCSIRDIGESLKLTDGSVKQHIFRAVRKVRAAVGALMVSIP